MATDGEKILLLIVNTWITENFLLRNRILTLFVLLQPSELFVSFDPEPLGVASLAQVHRATLKNGKEVAVKVQHHYVRGNAKVDIVTMEYCVKIMSWIFPDFKFQWLVDESKKNLPIELDFLHEGKNTEKVRWSHN